MENNNSIFHFEQMKEEISSFFMQIYANRNAMDKILSQYVGKKFKQIKNRFNDLGELEWVAFTLYTQNNNGHMLRSGEGDLIYVKFKEFNKPSEGRAIRGENGLFDCISQAEDEPRVDDLLFTLDELADDMEEIVNIFLTKRNAYYFVVVCEKGIAPTYIADPNVIELEYLDFYRAEKENHQSSHSGGEKINPS